MESTDLPTTPVVEALSCKQHVRAELDGLGARAAARRLAVIGAAMHLNRWSADTSLTVDEYRAGVARAAGLTFG